MGRRKQGGVPVSLFSFQDIITSICGILILIVLMFAIELTRHKSRSPEKKGKTTLSEEIRRLEQELVAKQKAQEDARKEIIAKGIMEYRKKLEDELAQLRKELSRQELETERLRQMLATLVEKREQMKKIVAAVTELAVVSFIPGKGSKKPTLVECSSTQIKVKGVEPRSFAANDQQTIARFFAEKIDKNTECLFLMLKPSAVDYAYDFAQDLRKSGFTVGWDAIEENVQIQLSK